MSIRVSVRGVADGSSGGVDGEVRFDAVYHNHFRCNLRKVVQYPNLWGYTRDIHQQPGIGETVVMGHIKRHYYMTHASLNPLRIVPKGPDTDFSAPHGRG